MKNLSLQVKKQNLSIFEFIKKSLSDGNENRILKIPPPVIKFYELISNCKIKAKEIKPSKMIKFIVSESGYEKHLKKGNDPKADERLDNIKELVSAAVKFEENHEKNDLQPFMDEISLHSDVDDLEYNFGRVSIMTMHSAKGLEFPVVFISGLEENLFPHVSSLYDPDELEEERRLCYVAMTRAKKYLVLSGASSRTVFGNLQYNPISRFVKEIPREFIERIKDRKAGNYYY